MKPNVYIIAGPNGAGKTTFAREFLPAYADCKNFINADLIAQGVSPFSPDAAAFRAGRIMLQEIEGYGRRGVDFGFETTLSGRSYINSIHTLKKYSYRISFFFPWVSDASLSLDRVRDRVLHGGHNIPEAVVRRRFDRSIRNFLTVYRPLAESWTIFNNSGGSPKIIASERAKKLSIISSQEYSVLIQSYGGK